MLKENRLDGMGGRTGGTVGLEFWIWPEGHLAAWSTERGFGEGNGRVKSREALRTAGWRGEGDETANWLRELSNGLVFKYKHRFK